MDKQAEIIHQIIRLASPDHIFLLGRLSPSDTITSAFAPQILSRPGSIHYHLLVLLSDFNHRSSEAWQENIESHCKKIMPLTVWVMQTAQFIISLRDNDYFASKVQLLAEHLYAASPLPPQVNYSQELAVPSGTNWINRSAEFIAAAHLFFLRKQNSMASFMLHQAVEQAYTAIIISRTGFRPPTHNLIRLRQYASWFITGTQEIFPSWMPKECCLLRQLQKAYIQSRYTNDFTIKTKDIEQLMSQVNSLHQMAALCCAEVETVLV